jgi:hypothetical protein
MIGEDGCFSGVGGCDGCIALVEPKVPLSLLSVRAMALEAMFREDGTNITVESDRFFGSAKVGGEQRKQ